MSMQIDSLRSWSHLLFWCSVLLPLLGVCAGVARFYVDRKEKALTSAISKAELDQSRKDFAELRSQTAPRHLSLEQKEAMGNSLRKVPPANVTLVSRAMDGESVDFAKDLGEVFTLAGWDVAFNKSALVDFQGVSLAFVAVDSTPPEYDIILRALEVGGIPVTKQEIKQSQVTGKMLPGVAVFIGRR